MAFFGLVILIAGVVIGGALMMIVAPHKLMSPPHGSEFSVLKMIPRLQHDLGLSPEQVEKIEPILKENMERLNEIRWDASDQIRGTLEQMNEQVSEILTEEQLRTWKHSFSRLQRPLGPGGPRRGNGAGGHRYRRGQQERMRRGPGSGPGPFDPGRSPAGPNFPRRDFGPTPLRPDEEPVNQDL
jgi:hypothetical protein